MPWEEKRKSIGQLPLSDAWSRSQKLIAQAFRDDLDTANYMDANRVQIGQDLFEKFFDLYSYIPQNRKAIFMGGVPGAGKTRIIFQRNLHTEYAIVDPDLFKAELAMLGLTPEIDGLTPLEQSCLAHQESLALSKKLFYALAERGTNILWDSTMSNSVSVVDRMLNLKNDHDFSVSTVFVHATKETAIKRVKARHVEGIKSFISGEGIGGRFIPLAQINFSAPEKTHAYLSVHRELLTDSEWIDNEKSCELDAE